MAGMLVTNFDRSKVFIGNNRTQRVTYTNSGGSTVNLQKGRLMGRVAANQKVLPHVSTATDGSEQPQFMLADDYAVAAGATAVLTVVDAGDVAEEKVILGGTDTLATQIGTGGPSIRDLIARNTQIKLVPSTEMLSLDPQ